jgi:hypothetical protein
VSLNPIDKIGFKNDKSLHKQNFSNETEEPIEDIPAFRKAAGGADNFCPEAENFWTEQIDNVTYKRYKRGNSFTMKSSENRDIIKSKVMYTPEEKREYNFDNIIQSSSTYDQNGGENSICNISNSPSGTDSDNSPLQNRSKRLTYKKDGREKSESNLQDGTKHIEEVEPEHVAEVKDDLSEHSENNIEGGPDEGQGGQGNSSQCLEGLFEEDRNEGQGSQGNGSNVVNSGDNDGSKINVVAVERIEIARGTKIKVLNTNKV